MLALAFATATVYCISKAIEEQYEERRRIEKERKKRILEQWR